MPEWKPLQIRGGDTRSTRETGKRRGQPMESRVASEARQDITDEADLGVESSCWSGFPKLPFFKHFRHNGPKVTFKDVAGLDDAVEELGEIVDFLKHPDKYLNLGAKIPRGVLIHGPSGSGKTLLARAVAGETEVPFFYLSGSDFVERFAGVGAKRVRDFFSEAKKVNGPCILFIDEIDAVGRAREGVENYHGDRDQTLNQILTEMDGFETTNAIVLAATNRISVLDPALLRPGRFTRHVHLRLPTEEGRKAILEIHARDKKLGRDVSLPLLAAKTQGFSGAELAETLNEAAILAGRRDKKAVELADCLDAVERIQKTAPFQERRALTSTVTFKDVAGIDEAMQELAEIVDFLKNPEKYRAMGGKMPKGVLVKGPPGVGKTLLAKAVAGEAGVPYFHISGSEFVEKYVGIGARRVRELFDEAKRRAPCIVFIDEIDAVGKSRAGLDEYHGERDQTLNQILTEMDGFEENNVIVLAATNRPDVLDQALIRPGRFDRIVDVLRPDKAGRKAILEVHARGKPLASELKLDWLADETPGFSGADLAGVMNEAALLAARYSLDTISTAVCLEAVERIRHGTGKKGVWMSQAEKERAAVHEAGHALMSALTPGAPAISRLSIMPHAWWKMNAAVFSSESKRIFTRDELLASMAMSFGGRVAEEIVFGNVSTMTAADSRAATQVARGMVMAGMGDPSALAAYDPDEIRSETTAREVEQATQGILGEAYKQAKTLLEKHRPALDRLAGQLSEKETLNRPELDDLLP